MNAQEANQLAKYSLIKQNEEYNSKVLLQIEEAAKEGKFEIEVPKMTKTFLKSLTEMGYNVSHPVCSMEVFYINWKYVKND